MASPQPATQKRPRTRLPDEAVSTFQDAFFHKNNVHPQSTEIKAWAMQFSLREDQIRSWFARHRTRTKKGPTRAASAVSTPAEEVEEMDSEEDQRAEEAAAKQYFHWIKEDKIIRLVTIFQRSRPSLHRLQRVADQVGLPVRDVQIFHKWRIEREGALYAQTNNTSPISPFSGVFSSTSHLPVLSNQASPIISEIDNKMDIDEESANPLPTPQASVERTPSPPKETRTEPEFVQSSFYDFWKARQTVPTLTSQPSMIPTKSLLSSMLSPAMQSFLKEP